MTPDADTPRWTLEAMLEEASWLRRLASALVRDPGAAEDLVQDTWVATLRAAPPADVPRRAWLRGVLHNLLRMRARSGARRRAHEAAAAPGRPAPDPADVAARLEVQRRLAACVAELEEPIRTTLALRYYEGLSGEEIARRLDVPAGTVRWRIHRGLDLLRARLDDVHGGRRSAWVVALAALRAPAAGGVVAPAALSAVGPAAVTIGGVVMSSTSKSLVAACALALVGAGAWSLGAFAPDPAPAPAAPVPERAQAPPADPDPRLAGVRSARASLAPSAAATAAPAPSPGSIGQSHVVGRVVDEAGAPLAATVRALGAGAPTATASDGRFAVHVAFARSGARASLEIAAPGHATRLIERDLAPSGVADLGDVVLLAGLDLLGRVVDERGEGVPFAWVTLARRATPSARKAVKDPLATPAPPPGLPSGLGGTFGPGRTPLDLVTSHEPGPVVIAGPDGAFVVPGLPAGAPSLLRAGATGHRTASASVTPGDGVEARIVCPHLGVDEGLEGHVRTDDGAPVARCAVAVRVEGPSVRGSFVVRTDAAGAFHVDTIAGAVYRLAVADAGQGLVSAAVEGVAAGRRDVTLVARPARTVEVVAVGEDGAGLAAYTWTIEAEGHVVAAGSQAQRHAFRPEGRLRVVVEAPGQVRASRDLETDAADERVVVSMRAVPAWTGVVLAGGAPARGARVALHRVPPPGRTTLANGFALTREALPTAAATTDETGGYRLAIPDAGRYVVAATLEGFAPGDTEPFDALALAAGTLPPIVLGRGGTIEGTVARGSGASADSAIVGASRGDGRVLVARADASGWFRFDGLAPGPWSVRRIAAEPRAGTVVFATTDEPPTWNAHVEAGRATRLDLAAAAAGTCTVRGRLSSGGEARTWSVSIDFPDVGRGQTETAAQAVGPDGTFRIETDLAGPHLLTFATHQGALRVHVPVRLAPGEVRADLAVDVGTVEVADDGPFADGRTMAVWEGADGTFATSNLRRGGAGRLMALVPAGRVRLVAYEEGVEQPDPRRWTTRAELDVPRGGTVVAAPR